MLTNFDKSRREHSPFGNIVRLLDFALQKLESGKGACEKSQYPKTLGRIGLSIILTI